MGPFEILLLLLITGIWIGGVVIVADTSKRYYEAVLWPIFVPITKIRRLRK